MRRHLVPLCLLSLALAAPLMAAPDDDDDRPGAGWITQARVGEILEARGYKVMRIRAAEGQWEGDAAHDGRRYVFKINPRSGRIDELQPDYG